MSMNPPSSNPPTTPRLDHRLLFENHLAFLGCHRGMVHRASSGIEIHSESTEFTFAFLEEGSDEDVLHRHVAVRLTPWSRGWEKALAAKRYGFQGSLVYMALGGSLPERPSPAGLEVSIVRTGREMELFSKVQTESFLQEGESREAWFEFQHAANMRNLEDSLQTFYVAFLDGEPVAVALLLLSAGIAGIYAVGTLPGHRSMGIGSALLARAVCDSQEHGDRTAGLQVARGSAAERLYLRLGFLPLFATSSLRCMEHEA